MAIVKQSYTGNGVQKLFTFTFPYLDPSHVLVTVNGTPTSAWSFANDNTVEFTVAPVTGAAILIYRETDSSALTATLVPGGPVPAAPINENFLQALYLGQESDDTAVGAAAQAATAATTATAANAAAATAVATANTASTNASAALSTANTASTNASTAVTTANSAVTTANSAVSTANAASASATSAVSTANAASSAASAATSTANTAAANAATALSTANTASTNASTAVSTANSAVTTANSAAATAIAASNTADNAEATANVAIADAAAAIAAVASAVAYTPVANLTALGALTPSNADFFELLDSTGAQSSGLITGVPGGLTGAPDLVFRLRYDSPPGTFTFLNYFASDPLSRFADISTEAVASAALPKAGGTMTGNITFAGTQTFPVAGIQDATVGQKGVVQLTDSVVSTSNTTAATPNSVKTANDNANTRLSRTGGTMTGNITFNGAQTFPVGGIQDGTTAQKGVVQLTDSVASTSTTTAATPNSVKSANDNANLRALKSGDTFTGSVTFANGSAVAPGVRWNTNYGFYYDSVSQEVRLAHAGTDRVAFYPTGEIYINQRNDGGEQTFMTIYRNASYQSEWYNTSTGNVNLRDLVSGNVLFSLRGSGAAAPYGLANFNINNLQTETLIGVRGALKYNGSTGSVLYSNGIITSVSKNGTGDYTVNIGTRASDNYVVTPTTRVNTTNRNVVGTTLNTQQLTTSVRINNNTLGAVFEDTNMLHVLVTEG